MTSRIRVRALALQPLLEVHLRVTLLLVAPGELSAALITAERFLAGVRTYMGGEVVAARERAHADATLERFLSGVNAYVPRELVAPREPSIAAVDRAGVRPLVDRRFARSIRIFARLHGHQSERQGALLIDLRQDLVTLRGARIVLGQLDSRCAGGGRRGLLLLLLLLLSLRLGLLRLLHIGRVTGRAGWLLLQRCLLVMGVRVMVREKAGIVSLLVRCQPARGGGGRRVMVTGRRRGRFRVHLQQLDGLAAVRGRVQIGVKERLTGQG